MNKPNQPILAYDTFRTNIIGLPHNGDTFEHPEYMTHLGYSDTNAYKVVKRTAKTMTLARVKVTKDPEWTPEFVSGGFAGHCTNQHSQRWVYEGIHSDFTVTVRLRKSRRSGSDKLWGYKGMIFIANGANEFYDYNF